MVENPDMKKLFIVLSVVALAFLSIYLFIPSKINFGKVVYINTNINIANRFIADEKQWNKWWPADIEDSSGSGPIKTKMQFENKNYLYTITRKAPEGFTITVDKDHDHITSFLQIISVSPDSVVLTWRSNLPHSINPIRKFSNYLLARKMKKNMTEIVQSAKSFLESKEQVYGLRIIHEKVKDTFLISTKYIADSFPSTETTYNIISELEHYIKVNDAAATNHPMVNVLEEKGIFTIMIAIPVNKIIRGNEKYFFKRMVAGNILVAEVKGGNHTIKEGLRQVKTYMDDSRLVAPAIPFESLITNRVKVTDTANWITRIYYPVI
jgi:hypothetical protein